VKEASEILRKVAKVNGNSAKISVVKLEAALNRIVENQHQDTQKNTGVWTLFSKKHLAMTTILLTISW
jgi:hypothetical protein